MRIVPYESPAAFRDDVFPFLLREEAMHCVGLGVVGNLLRGTVTGPFHLAAVRDGSDVCGAVWLTPPYPLGLSRLPAGALPELVDYLAAASLSVPGISGPKEVAEALDPLWVARSGAVAKAVMQQRFFSLERVLPPRPVAGRMRVVAESDVDLVDRWTGRFLVDCGLATEAPKTRRSAEASVRFGDRYLWEVDGEPVAMAGFTGPTPNGIRVNLVYTPPERRGGGFASALVAALTERLLAEGRRYCFLATDVANPTSNAIYERLGYRAVGDHAYFMYEGSV